MPHFKVATFGGELPRLARRLLPEGNAFQAWNCELLNGDLHPTRYSKAEGTSWPAANTPETIRAYYDTTGTFQGWLWLDQFNQELVVRPLPNDAHDRVYFLSPTGTLKVSDPTQWTFNLGGANRIDINSSSDAGIPQPAPRPTGSPTNGSATTIFDVSYVITYVDDYGAEGPGSTPSPIYQVTSDGTVTVTNNGGSIPSHVTKWRIYRAVTGTSATEYQFVGEEVIGTTTFVDNIGTTVPAETLVSQNWYPPETGLQGMIHIGRGILCAFKENTVYFSEQYLPHAWPPAYSITVGADIVGLAAISGSVVVLTNASPYVISGSLPSALTVQRMESEEACVSQRSIITAGSSVVYASPNGLITLGLGSIANLTDQSLTREQWEKMDPPNIRCFHYKDSVLAVYGNFASPAVISLEQEPFPQAGVMEVDSGQQGFLTFHEIASKYATVRSDDERFFWALENDGTGDWELYEFNPTPENNGVDGEYTWRSKTFVAPRPVAMSSAQVDAASYPVKMRVLADGSVHWVGDVTDDKVFRLPPGKFKYWEIELIGSSAVYNFGIGTSVRDLADEM